MKQEEILKRKTEEEKKRINSWSDGNVQIESLNEKEIVDAVSMQKTFLNTAIDFCLGLPPVAKNKKLHSEYLKAKKQNIDNLVDMYNDSVVENKFTFVNNKVAFPVPKRGDISLEIDGFKYEVPVNFSLKVTTFSNKEITTPVVPFNYTGIYSEVLDLSKEDTTIFKPAFSDAIKVNRVIYDDKTYSVGEEIKIQEGRHYEISNERIYFKREAFGSGQILVRYLPVQNAYEIDTLNEKLMVVELITDKDYQNKTGKLTKRLVLV